MADAVLEKTGADEPDQRVIRVDKAEQCCAQAMIKVGASISNVANEIPGLYPPNVIWLDSNGTAGRGLRTEMPATACKVVDEALATVIAGVGVQIAITELLIRLAGCISKQNCGDCMRRRAFPQKPQKRRWTTQKHRPRV